MAILDALMKANNIDTLKKDQNDDKLAVLADLVTITRTQSDKLGSDWEIISLGDVVVSKKYVAQANPVGTADNPIVWVEGMTPINNAYYMRDGVRYVWMGEWVEF